MLRFEEIVQNWTYGDKKTPLFEIYRAKIPGGWLIVMAQHDWDRIGMADAGYGWGYGGATFVPDPNHEWDGSSLQ